MRGMTVNELISALEQIAEEGLGDAEVRFAHQPSWPLQNHLRPEIAVRNVSDRDETQAVYLLDGDQVYDMPYAPAGIFKGRLREVPEEVWCPECERTDVKALGGPMFGCNRCGAEFDARDLPTEDAA